jgi:triosephosphate isomerase
VGICAPFTALDVCVEKLRGSGVKVLAQTMHSKENGAYTGEVSAAMLTELGVDGVVLGHSERRQYNAETDRALQQKVPAALAAGLHPILCVGETEEEREGGETQRKLRGQVQEALERIDAGRALGAFTVVRHERALAEAAELARTAKGDVAVTEARAVIDEILENHDNLSLGLARRRRRGTKRFNGGSA